MQSFSQPGAVVKQKFTYFINQALMSEWHHDGTSALYVAAIGILPQRKNSRLGEIHS